MVGRAILRKSVRFGTLRSSRAPGWGEDGEDSAQPEGPVEPENQAQIRPKSTKVGKTALAPK